MALVKSSFLFGVSLFCGMPVLVLDLTIEGEVINMCLNGFC